MAALNTPAGSRFRKLFLVVVAVSAIFATVASGSPEVAPRRGLRLALPVQTSPATNVTSMSNTSSHTAVATSQQSPLEQLNSAVGMFFLKLIAAIMRPVLLPLCPSSSMSWQLGPLVLCLLLEVPKF